MRIRSTKPEFWKSRRIASVDWDAIRRDFQNSGLVDLILMGHSPYN